MEVAPPQRGMVRIAPLGAIPELLRGFGVDPKALLRRYSLNEETSFADPDATVLLAAVGSLVKDCARVSACPHFGLLVGQRTQAATLGNVGELLSNAPDVGSALEALVGNIDMHDRGAVLSLGVCGETCSLGYEVYDHGLDGADQMSDCAMAVGWNILRALCGPQWSPIEVCLRHVHPTDVEPYRSFFQAPLRFNAGRTSLVFSTHWLGQPVRLADPNLRQLFLARIQAMRALADQNFRDQAHRLLVNSVGKPGCSREKLASQLSIHLRTLNRRLRDAGTSYRELHNEVRREMAYQLLRDTRRKLSAIASLLEYSDATAFSRAFSRWEGMSPARWRRRAQSKELPADADPPGDR